MKHSRGFIYMVLHALTIVLMVKEAMGSEEDVDPHSIYYDKYSKTIIKDTDLETVESSTEQYGELQNDLKLLKEENNFCGHERVFYKRLVNLLLSNIDIKAENDILIVGILKMEMSYSDMELLQNFDAQRTSLREIDAVLSNVIKKPQDDYIVGFMRIFDILLEKFSMALQIVHEHPDGALIIFTMLMVLSMLRMIKLGRGFPIVVIVQIIFILSFFMTWWELIKDAEIKFAAKQVKFDKMPISCEPHKMNTWDKIVSFFNVNEQCEQYYEATMSNPKLKITPAFALSHFITTVILHPITHIGTVVSVFINNATDGLSWTYAWIIRCILFLCVGLVIIVLPFCLTGATFNFGLGPLFRFGIDYQNKEKKGNSLQIENKRDPVQIILQIPHGTSVPAVKEAPREMQSKVLQTLQTNDFEEEDEEKCNIESFVTDFSHGDAAANNKSVSSDSTHSNKNKNLNGVKTKQNNGSGDG